MVLLRKLFDKLPSALEGLKPILLFPVCGILIMGVVMIAVNPVVGAINTGLNNFLSSMSGTSSILLGAVLGAMMSIDMGGPFNKAAYVFGTAQLTVANAGPEQYAIMAAVMAGGMVPPLAIALCTTFFKNRFTESERKSGVVNYIMGLSFITEGAIPFAAGDPEAIAFFTTTDILLLAFAQTDFAGNPLEAGIAIAHFNLVLICHSLDEFSGHDGLHDEVIRLHLAHCNTVLDDVLCM